MGELADHFNKEGHKTAKGNSFNKSSFTTILRNKKYIGIYEYDGTVSIAAPVPIRQKYRTFSAGSCSAANAAAP